MELSGNNIVVLINLLILIVSIILVLVYSKNRGLKITFIIFDLGLLIWLITLLLYYSPKFESFLLIIGRINFAGLLLTSIAYYFFIRLFVNTKKNLSWNFVDILLTIISGAFIPITLFTKFIAVNELVIAGGSRETLYGPGYPIYIIIIFLDLIIGLIVAIKNYKKSSKRIQRQIKIFLTTVVISLLIGAFTNIALPLLGFFDFQPYGTLALMMLNIGMTVLILRYQFLNIKVLLGRLFYFVIIQIFILLFFYLAFFLMGFEFIQQIPFYKILVPLVITLPTALIFDSLNNFMKKQVRTRFINPGYDPYEVIDDFNKKVLISTNLDEIQKEFKETINKTLRPSKIEIVLYSEKQPNSIEIKELDYFRQHFDDVLIYNTETVEPYADELEEIFKYMEEKDIRVVIPITNDKKVLGYIELGKKDLDSIFTQYDIEFCKNLTSIMSLSITRAQLYKEVEELNQSLKQKVSEQTKELQQKVKLLQEARRKEADMIDIMGHELRTPMSVVKLNTDLLHNFTHNVERKKEDFKKYVKRIKEAVDTEIKLINTLLSSAKLEGDKIELNPEKVDIVKQIEMALHAQEPRAKKKGIELITKFNTENKEVFADHARTVEVISNLIDNAVKYTQEGSVTVTTEDDGEYIEISVKDTGPGMSGEDIQNLGKKFYRTGNYTQSEYSDDIDIVRPGGTGLGLYVTFSLVKKMGGEIHVESKIGEGSSFIFTLPKYNGQKTTPMGDSKDMFKRLGLRE